MLEISFVILIVQQNHFQICVLTNLLDTSAQSRFFQVDK